jgi:cytochrome c peroxidase
MKVTRLFYIGLFLCLASFSCKKKCVNCHHFRVYENAKVGNFDIIAVKEACGPMERKKYVKQKSKGTDSKGDYHTFWECNLYPDDTSKAPK